MTIQRLVAAYKAKDTELMAKAKTSAPSAPVNTTPAPVTQRQTSLL
jgi:hypothetical protein